MDISELKDEKRAAFGYYEHRILIDYQNHLRQRSDQEEVQYTDETLAETLCTLYPNVLFTREEKREGVYYPNVLAETQPEFKGSLLEALGLTFLADDPVEATITSDPHGLRALFETEDGKVIFCAGGIGYINEGHIEFFDHDLDLKKLKEECQGEADEIENRLRDYFNQEINETLADPFFDAASEEQPIYFECGCQEELERLMQLFILTEPDIEQRAGYEVTIYAETEENSAYLDNESSDGYWSDRLDSLVAIALTENNPVGWEMNYNDGPYDRRSGYSMSPETISYNIEDVLELPARTRMAARRELKEWLQARDHNPDDYLNPMVAATDTTPPGETTPDENDDDDGAEHNQDLAPEDEAPLFAAIQFPTPSQTTSAE